VRMLADMYISFSQKNNWETKIISENLADHGGYRYIMIEIVNNGAYGTLNDETGVHRLVRISPFNSQGKRQTSFAMVDVVPVLEKVGTRELAAADLDISFARSSGPGGQNVNKRETAVRILHKPTNISVHVQSERTQELNREKALSLLSAKLELLQNKEEDERHKGLSSSGDIKNEWGSQIRSYVLHPYQLAKDHRTGVETTQVEKVLGGEIDLFLKHDEH